MYAFKPTANIKKFAPTVSRNIKFNPKVIIDGVILYSHDGYAHCKTQEGVYPLNEKSASVVGLTSIWCNTFNEDGEILDLIRVQDARYTIITYPHPYKYRDKEGVPVQGYITHKNEFHVTKRFDQRFSTRKQRESF